MPTEPEETFSDLEEFIPGSKVKLEDDRKRRTSKKPRKPKPTGWDRAPIRRRLPGRSEEIEFFTIMALCEALGKSPVTIRKWIAKGWLPKARYRLPSAEGPTSLGGKRLWSRAEVEGILKIAREEGIIRTVEDGMNVNYIPYLKRTNFVQRVKDFWEESKIK